MKSLLERLSLGEILVSDGSMGVMLQDNGLQPGECLEAWCIDKADIVKSIAVAYVAAGSDIIETNSFGGTSFKLREYKLEDKVAEFNKAAARLAKEAIGDKGYVAASVGPTGQIVIDEGGNVTEIELYNAFKEQFLALVDGGADAFCIETVSSVTEAVQAIKAAKDNTDLPVICTFTFETGARGFRTMMGVTPATAALAAVEAGADIVGANCGIGIDSMIEITKQIREVLPNTPILVQPNAGMPVLENGKTVFKDTPEMMAARVKELIAAGANIIGGCCGTKPPHISAMAKVVKNK